MSVQVCKFKCSQLHRETHTQVQKKTKMQAHKKKKTRIRETKHLSTNADSSTNTTVGWTKNTQKPNFFFKRKKSSKTQKCLEICQN